MESAATSTDSPKISVVIPTVGDRPTLHAAVASALSGSVPVQVVVAVDGGALSVELPSDPRLEVVLASRQGGASATRNLALNHASGDYVVFLDDDDVLPPHRLENDAAVLDRQHTLARLWELDDEGTRRSWDDEGVARRLRLRRPLSGPIPHLGCITVPRPEVVPFDETLEASEDVEWWFRQVRNMREFEVVPSVGYHRRSHGGPRLTQDTWGRLRARLRIIELHEAQMDVRELRYQLRRAAGIAESAHRPGLARNLRMRGVKLGDVRALLRLIGLRR